MAALTSPNIAFHGTLSLDGTATRVLKLECRKVSAADTIDLAQFGLSTVKAAIFVGVTVTAFVAPTIAGTVVTVPAGASNDTAWLVVIGS